MSNDDLWTQYGEKAAKAAFMQGLVVGHALGKEEGREEGRQEGLDEGKQEGILLGYALGYEDAKKEFISAAADGLRLGSSKCGKLMRDLQDD